MKVRCKDCYKVLNNNEEYCTKCGAHSSEVEKILKTGELPFNETGNFKTHLLIFLFLGCLLNGALYVAFGQLFSSMNSGYNYGEIGDLLPPEIRYFSIINALLVSTCILVMMAIVVNLSHLKNMFELPIKNRWKNIILGVGALIVFTVLTFYTSFRVVPDYFVSFLKDPQNDAFVKVVGSMNYFKVAVVLIGYSIIEEMFFRTAIMRFLDEATVWRPAIVIVVQALMSTALIFGALYAFSRFHGIGDTLILVFSNCLLQLLMGFYYYYNQRKIFVNVVFRVTLCLVFVAFSLVGGIL